MLGCHSHTLTLIYLFIILGTMCYNSDFQHVDTAFIFYIFIFDSAGPRNSLFISFPCVLIILFVLSLIVFVSCFARNALLMMTQFLVASSVCSRNACVYIALFCFVLFCQCSCDFWFVFVFVFYRVACFEFDLGL